MSEDEDSSSTGLPYTVPNLSHLPDDPSSSEDESLASLPPLPKRYSSRASASPYRTADRIPASQRLQLAQGRARSNLSTIQEEATNRKKPSSRSRQLPSREVSPQSSLPTAYRGQDRESTESSIGEVGEVANNSTHRSSSAADATIHRETPSTSTICAICQETISSHEKYFLPCFHVFHQQCIDDCFERVLPTNPRRCPTCRFVVHPAQSGVVDMTVMDDRNVAEALSETVRTRNTTVAPQSYTIPTLSSIQGSNEVMLRTSNNVTNRSPVVTTTTRGTATVNTVNSARAPRRRTAPSSTTTEQVNAHVKRRSTTFTQNQIKTLLDLCDEFKPIGEQGWKLVTESFLNRYPTSNKTWKGLRQKFNKLANVRYVCLSNLYILS